MGRFLADIIEEQLSKKVTVSGDELYQMFMEAFYVGADISCYDPNPNYSRDKGFVNSEMFKKLKEANP